MGAAFRTQVITILCDQRVNSVDDVVQTALPDNPTRPRGQRLGTASGPIGDYRRSASHRLEIRRRIVVFISRIYEHIRRRIPRDQLLYVLRPPDTDHTIRQFRSLLLGHPDHDTHIFRHRQHPPQPDKILQTFPVRPRRCDTENYLSVIQTRMHDQIPHITRPENIQIYSIVDDFCPTTLQKRVLQQFRQPRRNRDERKVIGN